MKGRNALAGVQRKISLGLADDEDRDGRGRLTIVGAGGGLFILKPPTEDFPEMPEAEHTTMRLASDLGLPVASCALMPMADGSIAYVTRRFDRVVSKNGRGTVKLHMEDMGQILARTREADKYAAELAAVGREIQSRSWKPGADAFLFLRMVLASFVLGNSDMHLRNIALLGKDAGRLSLSPVYDFLSVALVFPDDKEQSALAVCGKRVELWGQDFVMLTEGLGFPQSTFYKVKRDMQKRLPVMTKTIQNSLLSKPSQAKLIRLIEDRLARLDSD